MPKSSITAAPRDLSGAGAPVEADETYVTPEMIEAGAALICEHFYDVVSRESGVVRLLAAEVFLAMQTQRLVQTGKPTRAI